MMAQRTVYCGLVSEKQLGQTVTLKGWVQKRRDLGGVIFIDLRDREGIVQLVFNPEINKEAWEIADKCRSEYVIEVTGTVKIGMNWQSILKWQRVNLRLSRMKSLS